jgi:hypothetical protein
MQTLALAPAKGFGLLATNAVEYHGVFAVALSGRLDTHPGGQESGWNQNAGCSTLPLPQASGRSGTELNGL